MKTKAIKSGTSIYIKALIGINQRLLTFSKHIIDAITTTKTSAVTIPIKSIFFNGTISLTGCKSI